MADMCIGRTVVTPHVDDVASGMRGDTSRIGVVDAELVGHSLPHLPPRRHTVNAPPTLSPDIKSLLDDRSHTPLALWTPVGR